MSDLALSKASLQQLLRAVVTKIWSKPVLRTILQFYMGMGIAITASCMLAKTKDIAGKTVLITGGAAGLGKATALAFARRGIKRLVLWDINAEALAATKADISKAFPQLEILTASVDISRREKIYEAGDALLGQVGGFVDIVINNAGIVGGKSILEQDDRRIQMIMDVNAMALFWMAKKFLPPMVQRNDGHFVVISSLAGVFASPLMVDYSASKFAAKGFADALRAELLKLGKSGVKTLCVTPAAMNTALFKGFSVPGMPAMQPEYVAGKIADAVRSQSEWLLLPWLLPAMGMVNQALLPVWLIDLFNRPANNSMSKFDGTAANVIFEKMEAGRGQSK